MEEPILPSKNEEVEEELKKICEELKLPYLGREVHTVDFFTKDTTVRIRLGRPRLALEMIKKAEGRNVRFVSFLGLERTHPTHPSRIVYYAYIRVHVSGWPPKDYIIEFK